MGDYGTDSRLSSQNAPVSVVLQLKSVTPQRHNSTDLLCSVSHVRFDSPVFLSDANNDEMILRVFYLNGNFVLLKPHK